MKHFALFRLIKIIIIIQCFVVSAYADSTFTAYLNGEQQTPPNNSQARGEGSVILNASETQVTITLSFSGLRGTQTAAHIQKGSPGNAGFVEIILPTGSFSQTFTVTPTQVADLKAGLWYFNVRTSAFANGEIRGQLEPLCAPPINGAIAWYRADFSPDDSINGKHATLGNGLGYSTGKVGLSFQFDGTNDYASVADTPLLRPTNLTVQGWFNFSVTTGGVLVAKTAGTGTFESFVLYHDGTFLSAVVGGAAGLGEIVSFPFTPAVGEWYHISYTFDDVSNTQVLYLNGVAVGSGAATASIAYDSHPITIGAEYENESLNYFFKGKIDEVQFYNRALSASEVQSIYHGGSEGICLNTVFTNIYGNGKIAFSSNRTGISQIFTMNPNGTEQKNISNHPGGSNFEPAFSPDGSKIAFSSLRDGNYEVYVMNADGSNQIRLTNNPALDAVPNWSPDGTKIVFFSDRTGGGDIYVMNADGGNQTRLTTNAAFDLSPRFSPDGSRIVFVSRRDNNDEIYVMNANGTEQKRLTNHSSTDIAPAWSPDGTKIAFQSFRTVNYEIFVMNADGTDPINLSKNPAEDDVPAWSPDGSKIAFGSNRDGSYEIYTMNFDGTNQIRLTNNPALDTSAAWQPVKTVKVSPRNDISLTFSNISKAGYTTASSLAYGHLPQLPQGFLVRPGYINDIRTSALFTGSVEVQIRVNNILDSQECSALRILHYANGNWDQSNNSAPTFNAGICTLQQSVTSLSPFVVAELIPAAQGRAVAGNIIYGITPAGQLPKFVPEVSIVFTGKIIDTATTDSSGAYLKNNLDALDSYIVTPLKVGNVNGINAFDATLILRHVAAGGQGSNALNTNQRMAADTDADGQVTAFDSTQILRYVAGNGASTNTGQTGKWKFNPSTRNYDSMITSLSGEDYTAILVGELNGDWTP